MRFGRREALAPGHFGIAETVRDNDEPIRPNDDQDI